MLSDSEEDISLTPIFHAFTPPKDAARNRTFDHFDYMDAGLFDKGFVVFI